MSPGHVIQSGVSCRPSVVYKCMLRGVQVVKSTCNHALVLKLIFNSKSNFECRILNRMSITIGVAHTA